MWFHNTNWPLIIVLLLMPVFNGKSSAPGTLNKGYLRHNTSDFFTLLPCGGLFMFKKEWCNTLFPFN